MYGLDHDRSCSCSICRRVRVESVPITARDRAILADVWAMWRSTTDGEVDALLAGRDGSPGSPRWIALQAIAIARAAGAGT